MSHKQTIEELKDFTAVEQSIDSATLHGALTSLSPVKKGRMAKYFDGTITDGNTELRLVGFNSEHQRKMNTFFSNKKTVTLQNCQIKEARQGHKMEIMLKNSTIFLQSTQPIDMPDVSASSTAITPPSQLDTMRSFQKINVAIKAVTFKEPTNVRGWQQAKTGCYYS